MNKLRTLRWTSLMMTAAFVVFSCGSDGDSDDPAPTASFSVAPDADDFRIVTFANASQNATDFQWDFGDDSDISTEENPVHTFNEPGTYTVKLTANTATSEVTTTKNVTITPVLTNKMLNGGGSKSWKLKAAGGAFMVGPTSGSGEWYPGINEDGSPKDLSAERPCLFNDEFIFKTDNVYEYDANGDVWAESYMGYSDGDKDKCQSEETLPEGAEAWGSGAHTYAFTKATTGASAKITVTGTGAFMVLPKAMNDAEYAAAPPTADASVVYEVLSYDLSDGVETLVITIDIGPGFWTFALVNEIE